MKRRQFFERAAAALAAITLPSWLWRKQRPLTFEPIIVTVTTVSPFNGEILEERSYELQRPTVLRTPIYQAGVAEGRSTIKYGEVQKLLREQTGIVRDFVSPQQFDELSRRLRRIWIEL